jgi:hypothetical protein
MEVLEVTASEFECIISKPYFIFGKADFSELNRFKTEKIFFLLFKNNKYRLGLIAGIIENKLHSPFSAPFGGFVFLTDDVRLPIIEEALELLEIWARGKNIKSIQLTLPPTFYHKSFVSKQINSLFRKNYEISKIDLNYWFDVNDFDEKYFTKIWYSARKNLQIAQKAGMNFKICGTDFEKKLAYDIIQKNRNGRGYPLRMSWQQILETIRLLPSDFFLIENENKISIASAIVFHVSDSVVQVIYWGDLHEYAELRTMNFLSFKIFEFYKDTGKRIIDIGPSSENSIPNYGLCEFKEGIGCHIDEKFTFIKALF